jgi:hypothetical protein
VSMVGFTIISSGHLDEYSGDLLDECSHWPVNRTRVNIQKGVYLLCFGARSSSGPSGQLKQHKEKV